MVTDDLSRYRWHTGAALRPLAPDERCPVLFRDLGPAALARFLRGALPRLAGPYTPLLYMRTEDYAEPYTDHANIGRIVILRPDLLAPWHAGVPRVYVARATRSLDAAFVGYAPGGTDLHSVAREARAMTTAAELREHLGGRLHDERVAAALDALDALDADLAATEALAAPLRVALQSGDRDGALTAMAGLGITEDDLCAAWHHLPAARRDHVRAALRALPRGPWR